MTTEEVKRKFVDKVAEGNWALQVLPCKYNAPMMLWLLIWLFYNWGPEAEDFISNFMDPYEFYGWLSENISQLVDDWVREVDEANGREHIPWMQ